MITSVQRIARTENDVRKRQQKPSEFTLNYMYAPTISQKEKKKEENKGRQEQQDKELQAKDRPMFQLEEASGMEEKKQRLTGLLQEMNAAFEKENACYMKISEMKKEYGIGRHSLEQIQLETLKQVMAGENLTREEKVIYQGLEELTSYQKQALHFLKAAKYWNKQRMEIEELIKLEL